MKCEEPQAGIQDSVEVQFLAWEKSDPVGVVEQLKMELGASIHNGSLENVSVTESEDVVSSGVIDLEEYVSEADEAGDEKEPEVLGGAAMEEPDAGEEAGDEGDGEEIVSLNVGVQKPACSPTPQDPNLVAPPSSQPRPSPPQFEPGDNERDDSMSQSSQKLGLSQMTTENSTPSSSEDEEPIYHTPFTQQPTRKFITPKYTAPTKFEPSNLNLGDMDPFEGFDIESGSEKEFLMSSLEHLSQAEIDDLKAAQAAHLRTVQLRKPNTTSHDVLDESQKSEMMDTVAFTRDENGNYPIPQEVIDEPINTEILKKWSDHFIRCHRLIVNSHVQPTTVQRREFQRDIYDFCRGMGMEKLASKTQVQEGRRVLLKSRGKDISPDSDQESTSGIERDDKMKALQIPKPPVSSLTPLRTPVMKRSRDVEDDKESKPPSKKGKPEEKERKPGSHNQLLYNGLQSKTKAYHEERLKVKPMVSTTTSVPIEAAIPSLAKDEQKKGLRAAKNARRRERKRASMLNLTNNAAESNENIIKTTNGVSAPDSKSLGSKVATVSQKTTPTESSAKKDQKAKSRRGQVTPTSSASQKSNGIVGGVAGHDNEVTKQRKADRRKQKRELDKRRVQTLDEQSILNSGSVVDSSQIVQTMATGVMANKETRSAKQRAAKAARDAAGSKAPNGNVDQVASDRPAKEGGSKFVDLRAPKKKRRKRSKIANSSQQDETLEPRTEQEAHENFLKSQKEENGAMNVDPLASKKPEIDNIQKDIAFNTIKAVENFQHGGDKGLSREAKESMRDEAKAVEPVASHHREQLENITHNKSKAKAAKPSLRRQEIPDSQATIDQVTSQALDEAYKTPAQIAQMKREASFMNADGTAKSISELSPVNTPSAKSRKGSRAKRKQVKETVSADEMDLLKVNHS